MASSQGHKCKGCGLLVQPGYPRCPRCTMPLPENRKRTEAIAGATTVGQESQTYLWIGLAVLALVAAGVGYAAMGKGGDRASTTTTAAASRPLGQDLGDDSVDPTVPVDDDVDDDVGISLDDAPPTESEKRQSTLSDFEQSLSDDRLWATMTVEGGDTLNLVSGACSDDGMQPAIAKARASLRAVGFKAIRCLEKHGALAFEQAL